MLDEIKKILRHKTTHKIIFGMGILYTLANMAYQEVTCEERYRRIVKEELALLNEKKEN